MSWSVTERSEQNSFLTFRKYADIFPHELAGLYICIVHKNFMSEKMESSG
jgi:hypothetical protein